MKERNYNFDLLRIFSCILIICMHGPMPTDNANGIFLSSLSYFSAPGLCIFFILSGALILPVKMDTFSFLKRRLGKVVCPTLFFTFVSIALTYFQGTEIDWLRKILSIPFSNQGGGILWFMYTLIGLYLLSPIISKWLQSISRKEKEFYLLLWGITLCYPILSLFLDINTTDTGILYYLSSYVGYFVLGYYLNKYPDAFPAKIIIPALFIAIAAPVICKLTHIEVDFYSVFWYRSIFVATLCVSIYKFFTFRKIAFRQNNKLAHYIVVISNLTFGIYLIHLIIMRQIIWKCGVIINIDNYYVQCFAIIALTFIISLIITYFVSLLPFGDYIIGYKQKRK